MLNQLPVISSRTELVEKVQSALATAGLSRIPVIQTLTAPDALDYLSVELPHLAILDTASSDIDAIKLARVIAQDPWLLQGNIIAIYNDHSVASALQDLRGANIVVTIEEKSLERELPRTLQIIHDNSRLMYQRSLDQNLVSNISAEFELANDPFIARCYVNLICSFLYNTGRIALSQKGQFQLALTELFMNAIEHGNCKISAADKTAWLESGKLGIDLIHERNTDPELASRTVHFEYSLLPDRANFLIRDQGDGFDWRSMPEELSMDNLLALHGRGIFMSRQATSSLEYNAQGNEVRFSIIFDSSNPDWAPGVFGETYIMELPDGATVCQEGESSDALYYIVSGTYQVQVSGNTVAELNQNDVFIGDMSFLLHSPRTATVSAVGPGRLIKITRRDFALGIRKNPHYALFLARLQAQRMLRQNQVLMSMMNAGAQPA